MAAIVVAVTRRRPGTTSPIYLLLAMLLMVYVSLSNVLEHLAVTSSWDYWEDHAEILFLPLLTYMMYRMHAEALAARSTRQSDMVAQLSERLSDSMTQLDEQRLSLLQALSAAVDARDHYTARHSIHVADYACAIARRLGMDDEVDMIEQAGLLHDVGKIGIADHILLKRTSLTASEYDVVKRHSDESARIVETVPFLAGAVAAIRHHHEHWDGNGYPAGLSGTQIPRAAAVLAVADAFDAMTTDRPYRAARDVASARRALREGRGTQFSPEAVDALLELLDEGVVRVWGQTGAA